MFIKHALNIMPSLLVVSCSNITVFDVHHYGTFLLVFIQRFINKDLVIIIINVITM